jgi:hypothetical protein
LGLFWHRLRAFLLTEFSSSLSLHNQSGTLSFPFPTKNKTKKIEKKQQSISFVAASVVALQASPALALNAIELTDKRAENVGGLQLIYEVCFYSYRFV